MYATHNDKTKHPEGEKLLKAAIAQGCSDSLAAYAQYYIAEPAIKSQWLTIAQQHGSAYAKRQIDYDNAISIGALETAKSCAYSKKFLGLGYLVNAAANFRLASILLDKETAQRDFNEMIELYRVALLYRPRLNNYIMYHYGLAFDNAKLDALLEQNPSVFVERWKDDYEKPRHPKMKEQAITFVLQVDPAKLSSAANGLLATALAQCSEKILKDKAGKFSAEKAKQVDIQRKVAAMDAKSAAALPAHSMLKEAAKKGATAFAESRFDVEVCKARTAAATRPPVSLQLSINAELADATVQSPVVSR